MPYSPMKKSCTRMYDEKGKQTGLMMEGSVAYMENTDPEEKKAKPKKETRDAYIDKMLSKLQKEKPGMNPMEMMKYAKNSYEALPPEKKEK